MLQTEGIEVEVIDDSETDFFQDNRRGHALSELEPSTQYLLSMNQPVVVSIAKTKSKRNNIVNNSKLQNTTTQQKTNLKMALAIRKLSNPNIDKLNFP